MSPYRIIGIHGLNNKPPAAQLAAWWRDAITEGLARNLGLAHGRLDFELVYWADVRSPAPLTDDPEPYVAADGVGPLPRHAASRGDSAREMAQGALDKLSALPRADRLVQEVMNAKTPDLRAYYTNDDIRDTLRQRLREALARASREQRRVMLIAHSMGSVIAFDVLVAMPRAPGAARVQHLVTVGSPLGLHEVKQQARDQGFAMRVPEAVEHWTNHADRRDRVAFDSRLATDYAANASGVGLMDALVVNGYATATGVANPHKIYGYLRTPEMSDLIDRFIQG